MAIVAFITSVPLVVAEMVLGNFQWPSTFGWGVIVLAALLPCFSRRCFLCWVWASSDLAGQGFCQSGAFVCRCSGGSSFE